VIVVRRNKISLPCLRALVTSPHVATSASSCTELPRLTAYGIQTAPSTTQD
jgi:hypothetical protein